MLKRYAVSLSFLATHLLCREAYAILDFLATEAKEAAEAAAVAEAAGGLLGEISPDSDAEAGVAYVRDQSSNLAREINDTQYLMADTKDFIKGPKWSAGRVEHNIRSTTGFIRRGKNVLMRLAALGPNAMTAFNGVQTNIALNEIQQNQQTLIIQNNELANRQAQKEVREAKSWTEFIARQRALRRQNSTSR